MNLSASIIVRSREFEPWEHYRAGRFPGWVKVKNRKHPAMDRVKDAFK